MWLAHSFARLSRSAIANIGKSLSFCVGGSVNIPRLNCSHVGRSIGWMFSHARFSSFRCSISLMSVSSIQIFFVKSSYFIALFTRRSKPASRRSPKLINLFSSHAHTVIIFSTTFSILSFRASITFNMRILNHRLTRKSTLYFIFFFFFLSDNETQSQRGGAPRGLQNKVFSVNYSFTILQLETIHLARACLMACSLSTLPREFPWLTALHQPKVPWPWPSFSLSLCLS